MQVPFLQPQSRAGWNQLSRRPAILVLISVSCLLMSISPNWKPDQDSVAYLSMARSFASGRGLLHLGLRQWHYAPLYPVVISPAFWFQGRPFLLISLINVATAASLVLGTFFWFGKYSQRVAGLVAALVGVNIGLWDVCREPRSDTLFSALLIWAAVCFASAVREQKILGFVLFNSLGGLLVVAATFTRQVGIFLTAGFALAMFIRWMSKRTPATFIRMCLAIVPGMFALVAVIVLVRRDHDAAIVDHASVVGTYTEQYRQTNITLAAQILDGVRRQTGDVGRLLIPGMWGSFAHFGQWLNFNTILYAIFTIPVANGWWRLVRRTGDPLLCTVPFYAAMFTLWPFDQGTRFNVPMLPVMWASVWMMLSRWPRKRVSILTIVLGFHLLASVCYLIGDDLKVARWNRGISPMEQLAGKVSTTNQVVTIGGATNDILIWRYLLDRPVRHLLKSEPVPDKAVWLLQPKMSVIPPRFRLIATSGEIQLLRRRQ